VVFWQTFNKYRGIVEFSGFSGKLPINIEGLWSLVVFWQTFDKYRGIVEFSGVLANFQ